MSEGFCLKECCKYYDGKKCRCNDKKNFRELHKAVEKKDRRLDLSHEKSNYLRWERPRGYLFRWIWLPKLHPHDQRVISVFSRDSWAFLDFLGGII